jgi:TonB-linked SusC/RagA family outer membrane protein
VIDAKGESIPGVTITFEDKSVTTDIEGKYSINVKNSKSLLRYTFIGYEPQIVTVGKNKKIDIKLLESNTVLDDVVVIGYGTRKKSLVTGSISKYTNERLDDIAVTRLDQALQGKIAGVQVQNISSEAGADSSINIRGISSINAGASPLVVVDGQPIPDGLSSINMADVASVEVLKDAASSAIYGSRGASGVILITTKSGKTDKVKYAFKYSSGFKTAYEKYPIMSTPEYIDLLYKEKAIRATDPYFIANPLLNNIIYNGSVTKQNNILAGYAIHQIMMGGDAYIYQDEVLRNADFKNIQLSANGGNKNMRYAISSGYQGEEGIMLKSNFEKFNLRSKVDIDLSKRTKLNINLNPSYQKKSSPSENYTNFWRYSDVIPFQHNEVTAAFVNQNPQYASIKAGDYAHPRHFIGLTYPATFPDGSPLVLPDGTNYAPSAEGSSPSNSAQNNPMASLLNHDYDTKSYGLQAGTTLSINIMPGLDFKTLATLYIKNDKRLDWTSRNADADGVVNKGIYYTNSYIDLLSENTFTYKKEIKENSFDVLVGYTAQKTTTSKSQTTGQDYASDTIRSLNNATIINKAQTFGSDTEVGLLSYLGRINYAYKSKYLLSASYRTDGSSYFGAGKKWGSFPAASVGWVVNKEKFLSNVNWINKLTLRGSYGVSGNNRILDYGFVSLMSNADYSFGSGNGTVTNGQATTSTIIANRDITWESTFQTNVGFDLSLFKNRINLTVDAYKSLTDKLLLQQATQAFVGVPLAWNNLGSLNNKGFEIELSTTNVKSKSFKWTTSANLSHTQNKVRELGDEKYLRNQGERTEIYQTKVGDPLVQFYGYKTDGIWTSPEQIQAAKDSGLTTNLPSLFTLAGLKLVDVNGDNRIDNNDRTVIGNPYPDFTWGLTNTMSYKAVDLTFSWQGVQGGELINGDPNYGETRSKNKNYTANRWISPQNPGDGKTPYEDVGFNWLLTDYVVEDASYFALREVNIGYTLPSTMVKRIGLSNLRLYASGQNLFFNTASEYRGINPEGRSTSGPYASAIVAGYQRGSFPIAKTIVIGLDINF